MVALQEDNMKKLLHEVADAFDTTPQTIILITLGAFALSLFVGAWVGGYLH